MKTALITLIQEKRYEEISIVDIIRRADVGRSTFYSHFRCKEDLLFCGFDQWLASHGASCATRGRMFRFSLPFLKHMENQPGIFRASMRGAGGVRVRMKVKQILISVIGDELRRMTPGFDCAAKLAAHSRMLAGAFLALSSWWRIEAPELASEEVDELFQEFALAAVGISGHTLS